MLYRLAAMITNRDSEELYRPLGTHVQAPGGNILFARSRATSREWDLGVLARHVLVWQCEEYSVSLIGLKNTRFHWPRPKTSSHVETEVGSR